MSGNTAPFNLFKGPTAKADPGDAKTLAVDRSPCLFNLISTAAQTRTLSRPEKEGSLVLLHMQTDGGDITVTVTGGYNEFGDTTFVFSDVGQFAFLASFATSAGVLFWRLISHHGIGNTPANDARAELVITTKTVTAQESGKTFFLDLAAGFVVTLPAVALGLRYLFVIKTAVTGSTTIVCPGAASLFKGQVLTTDVNSVTDPDFDTTAVATLTFVLNKSVAGDRIQVECDGTNWHYLASCSVFDAITGS